MTTPTQQAISSLSRSLANSDALTSVIVDKTALRTVIEAFAQPVDSKAAPTEQANPTPTETALWRLANGARIGESDAKLLLAHIAQLTRENKVLEKKNAGTLANNLCPDHRDKQTGKPCLACTIEQLTREKEALVQAGRALMSYTSHELDCGLSLSHPCDCGLHEKREVFDTLCTSQSSSQTK